MSFVNRFIYACLAVLALVSGTARAAAPEVLAEAHQVACEAYLRDADLTLELFGGQADAGRLLLRYLLALTWDVQSLEDNPRLLAASLQHPETRLKLATVAYARTFLGPVLQRFSLNAQLRQDPGLDPDLGEMADEERQMLMTEVETHKNELLTQVDEIVYGHEKDGAVIVEIEPAEGRTFDATELQAMAAMYLNLGRKQHWSTEIIAQSEDQDGLRKMTLRFRGPHAIRWLTSEAGIHRSIKVGGISIAARNKTFTTYSRVSAYEEPERQTFEMRTDRLEVTTFRASGAGGQHINTTDSAVRVRDLDSGIEAVVSSQRSQHANKEVAFSILRAKLYALHLAQERAALARVRLASREVDTSVSPYVRTYDVRYNRTEYDAIRAGNLRDIFTARQQTQLLRELQDRFDQYRP